MIKLAELLELPDSWDPKWHPVDANFADADLLSLHEAICDLARMAARDPSRYSDIPSKVADLLEQINYSVLYLVEIMTWEEDEI